MWSLKQTLANLAAYPPDGYNHLPNGFDPAKGIRSLFPAHKTCNISSLKNYVFSFTGWASTPEHNNAQMLVIADGAGRWGINAIASLDPLAISWAGGFVFKFSSDSAGHGFVINNANVNNGIVNGFNEPWLLENWCDAFPQGVNLWMWVEDTTFVAANPNASKGPANDAATSTNSNFKTLEQFTPTSSVQLPPAPDAAPGQGALEDPLTQ
jgi:hypothetical protein